MKIVDPSSLSATLDAVNDAFFHGRALSKSERERAAQWIARRQGRPGSYADMFAPTDRDFAEGTTLFTGETIRTRAGMAHILGEEACRALILLNVSTSTVRQALDRASLGMMSRLRKARELVTGTYCCGKCTCALWRHLAVGGLENAERRLAAGMKTLKFRRDGRGKWKVFPFHYTLLALSEIDLPSAIKEMRYAAPVCEQLLNRRARDDKYDRRRRVLAERILAKC
jgi:hypothetical protein